MRGWVGGWWLQEGFPGFAFAAETVGVLLVNDFLGLSEEVRIYRAICCSRSCILAKFEAFLGFGFGNEGGGVDSFCGDVSVLFRGSLPGLTLTYSIEPVRQL